MKYIMMLLGLALLAGCEENPKLANPSKIDLGVVDGCIVKYIDRGERNDSFFLAKCGNTTTTTSNYTTSRGKSVAFHRTTAVTVEELNKEIIELSAKRDALSKLTDEEKKLLGVQP